MSAVEAGTPAGRRAPEAYGLGLRGLHWLMAALLIGLLAAIEIKGELPKGELKSQLVEWHKQAGLTVLLLVWVRLLVRLLSREPPIEPPLSLWSRRFAALAHGLLYLSMATIPVLGILFLQAKGREVGFFGWILPELLDEDRGLPYALNLKTAHEWLGNALMVLIALHVAAALHHQWIRRDNTLARMLGRR